MKIVKRKVEALGAIAPAADGLNRIELSFASDKPYKRLNWETWEYIEEILVCESSAMVDSRLEDGMVPFLWNHNTHEVKGAIEGVEWGGGKGRAIVKLSRNATDLYQDIADGIIKGASVGYRVHEHETVSEAEYEEGRSPWDRKMTKPKVVKATKWEIFEISAVSIPADASVGIDRAEGDEDWLTSLRGSEYPQFDRAYAESLKEDYPDIWDKGGNVRGNEAFELWGRARSGDKADEVISWINEREAWIARHYQDFRLPGVVAQIKWGAIGTLGEKGMKDLIQEEKDKMNEKESEKSTTDWEAKYAESQNSLSQFRQENEQLRQQVADLQKREAVISRYTAARSSADKLVSEAKMSKAEFDKLFAKSADDLLKGEEAIESLRAIELVIEMAGDRAPSLNLKGAKIPPEISETDGRSAIEAASKKAVQGYENAWKN